jgi:hypothetical protein
MHLLSNIHTHHRLFVHYFIFFEFQLTVVGMMMLSAAERFRTGSQLQTHTRRNSREKNESAHHGTCNTDDTCYQRADVQWKVIRY